MTAKIFASGLLAGIVLAPAAPTQKPRVFITETMASQAAAEAGVGNAKGSLLVAGGTSPQNLEVVKTFARYCPAVTVTGDRGKAEYVIELDHDPISPTTAFVHGNKVAVFNKDADLIYSNSTRTLSKAVKGACASISVAASPAGK